MEVVNAILELPMIPEISYEVGFATEIVESLEGSESRIPRRSEYRLSASLGTMELSEGEWLGLKSFFELRQGKTTGFLWKCPFDSELSGENFPADGVSDRGRLIPLGDNRFQICRVYEVYGVKGFKPIRWPIASTVRVFANGSPVLSGWTVNASTGQIQFTIPVGDLSVECDFYYPVRFDVDSIQAIQVSGGADEVDTDDSWAARFLPVGARYTVSGVKLVEVVQPIAYNPFVAADFADINGNFTYPIIPERERSPLYRTEIQNTLAGVERSELRNQKQETTYLAANLYRDEVNTLIAWMSACKGKTLAWGTGERFETDTVSFTQLSPDFFSVGEIKTSSCPLSQSLSYHLFGTYYGKHNIGDCNTIAYWRTVNPIAVATGDIANLGAAISLVVVDNRWKVRYRGNNFGIARISPSEYRMRTIASALTLENLYYNITFGLSLIYRDKNLPCTGNLETPSYPRGDDVQWIDTVLVSDTLVGRSVPLATFCRIDRSDGEIQGFSSWDCTLAINGVEYKADTAIVPSAVSRKADLSADNVEVRAFLSDEGIREIDILSGKYNGALVTVFAASVVDLGNRTILFDGYIGEVKSSDTSFTFELRSRAGYLDRSISVKTDARCGHRFCDEFCGLNINNYTVSGFTVTEVVNSRYARNTFQVLPGPSGDFSNGYAEFTSGQLEGAQFDIRSTNAATNEVAIVSPLPLGLATGDTLKLVRGCSKTPAACQAYGNYPAFGGFPSGGNWMPGTDVFAKAP